jgi:23S rRNA (adenine2503-C2)-methyltransferase
LLFAMKPPHIATPSALGADLLGWTRAEIEQWLFAHGFKPVHADAIWAAMHRRRVSDVDDMAEVPERVRAGLREAGLHVGRPEIAREHASTDGFTRKFLLRFADGEAVETVLMFFTGRATACVSTQAGCAMGCVFCATGQAGFRRQLTTAEIVAQVLHVARVLAVDGRRLRNVVLMGQGEPLHNYDAVMRAVDAVIDQKGLELAAERVTLSTVGLVPGIRRLAEERRPMSLALSLHGATDQEREALVPVAKRWPLAELMDACRYFTKETGRGIFFEWTLIEGRNDSPEQAAALGRLLARQKGQVNLIPLNPTAGYGGSPTGHARAKAFQAVLREHGLPSTLRQRRGIDIAAGCGQLAGAGAM